MLKTDTLIEKLGLKVFNSETVKVVTGGYCGDLLSWVMGKVECGCAWATVMNNINVAAVAVLRDVACVVLTEGVQPDQNLLNRSVSEDITLLGFDGDSYTFSVKLAELLKDAG